jgi:predicted RNase H-like HicB family nuclease
MQREAGFETRKAASLPFVIRCVLEEADGQWHAYSLEFGLAAQADTEEEAKAKLGNMISSYLYDALAGEDREHAPELLRRRASPEVYAKYYVSKAAAGVASLFHRGRSRTSVHDGGYLDRHLAYSNPVPVMPMGCAAE